MPKASFETSSGEGNEMLDAPTEIVETKNDPQGEIPTQKDRRTKIPKQKIDSEKLAKNEFYRQIEQSEEKDTIKIVTENLIKRKERELSELQKKIHEPVGAVKKVFSLLSGRKEWNSLKAQANMLERELRILKERLENLNNE